MQYGHHPSQELSVCEARSATQTKMAKVQANPRRYRIWFLEFGKISGKGRRLQEDHRDDIMKPNSCILHPMGEIKYLVLLNLIKRGLPGPTPCSSITRVVWGLIKKKSGVVDKEYLDKTRSFRQRISNTLNYHKKLFTGKWVNLKNLIMFLYLTQS